MPIFGPWVELGFVGQTPGFDDDARIVAAIGLALDGIAQALGVALMIYGVASPKHAESGRDAGSTRGGGEWNRFSRDVLTA